MANDNATIVIEAEDKASAQLRRVAEETAKTFARTEKIKQEQLNQLAIERTLLLQGAEAAESMRLQQQGLDAETANLIARERALIQEQKKLNEQLDQTSVKLPEAFKETKSISGFMGQLSSLAGGGQISSLISDVGSLTGRISAFNKAAAAGEAATLGLKAGIVAAVAAASVKVGLAIGDWAFQTAKWNRELDLAIEKSRKLDRELTRKQEQKFSDDMARIDLLPANEQDQARIDYVARLNTELGGVQTQVTQAERDLARLQEWDGFDWSYTLATGGDLQNDLAVAQQNLEAAQDRERVINQQIEATERQLGVEKELAQARKEQAEAQQSANYIQSLIDQQIALQHELEGTLNTTEIINNTIAADREQAVALQQQIEETKKAIAERDRQERERQQAQRDEEQRLKRIQDLEQQEIEKLKEQRILLNEGAEAAHRYRLERQGLSAETAAAIAAEQAAIDRLKAAQNQKPEKQAKQGTLQAFESRLLTRGSGDDPQQQLVKLTERQTKILERNTKIQERIARREEKREQRLNLRVVN